MIKIFIAKRTDYIDWDECTEQTILAFTKDEALELACIEYGDWEVTEMELVPQVLAKSFAWG